MTIKLSKPFAPNSHVDEYDVRQIKKALNRLGYYQPYEKTGMTAIPDKEIFASLKSFQKDYGINETGEARPDDQTIKTLSKESSKTPKGHYIWRAVEDNKSRKTHAGYNRSVRSWADLPHPGHDEDCRCWAQYISDDKIQKEELPSPKIEIPKIPGTNIPDRGIPEQGWPGSRQYDPYKPKVEGDDPYFVMPTTPKDNTMEKYPPNNWPVKKEWDL